MSNLNTSTGHYEYGMDMSPQLSLTDGDWCEDGTWSVIFAIGTFVLFVLFHQVMYFYKGRCTNNKGTEPNTHVEYQNQGRSLTESMIERVFVAPFVPKKLETLVALIFGAWFMMTIPMAFTRYFEGWWGQQLLTQQGPFNLMANAIGCKGLDMNAIKYAIQAPQDQEQKEVVRLGSHAALAQPERVLFPQESPEEQEFASAESSVNAAPKSLGHSPDIDYYFALHLFFGMVWLTMGGIQIYLAKNGWSSNKEVRHSRHRVFGFFSVLAFAGHIGMVMNISWRNPVHQNWIVLVVYWATVVESIALVATALIYIKRAKQAQREGNNAAAARYFGMHMVRMFIAYIQSNFGSGSIRLTAWMLWVLGKFFSMPMRIKIDRGECQSMALNGYPFLDPPIPPTEAGSAEHCWTPVFLNLATTNALLIWLEWIFFCIPIAQFAQEDKNAILSKAKQFVIIMVAYLFCEFVLEVEDFTLQVLIFVWAGIIRLHSFRLMIAQYSRQQVGRDEEDKNCSKSLWQVCVNTLLDLLMIDDPVYTPHQK